MINLKKIEIYGFKSFADRTEIKFEQPITGIVGPNGCGKSNVSDAIRWVLGEQSTRMLRGKSMVDLIFSGTDRRSSMSYCEVSLFMDNTNRIFPVEVDELIISRKLYRNGDSEYLLNKTNARLKDILDLLRNVGLGKDGYSIVGQGRMDAVLNAKPTERRAIFEEALGISSFRYRKNETERKLERTKQNMDTLAVMLSEIERQIAPLTRQATNAKKALDIAEKLKYYEVNSYIYNYDNAYVKKSDSRNKLNGLNEELNIKTQTHAQLAEVVEQLSVKLNNVDEMLTDLHDKNVTLSVKLQSQCGDVDLAQERIKNAQIGMDDTGALIAKDKSAIDAVNADIADIRNGLAAKNNELLSLDRQLKDDNANLVAIKEQCDSLNSQLLDIEARCNKCNNNIALMNVSVAKLSTEATHLISRREQLEQDQEHLNDKLSSLSGEEGQLVRNVEDSRISRNRITAEIDSVNAIIRQQEGQLFEHSKSIKLAEQNLASLKGSNNMLDNFVNNYKGYHRSVADLMADAKEDDVLMSKICGTVAKLIDVEPKYLTAVEVALGNRLENIVTRNEIDAKYIIKHLKDFNRGRVRLLPINSMKKRNLPNQQLLSEVGAIGSADSLISYDKQYDSVFMSLLGGVLVVDTYDNAYAIARKYNSPCRIVTLSGENLGSDGSVEGGSSDSRASGLLTYDSRIKEGLAEIGKLESEIAVLSKEHDVLVSDSKANKDKLQLLNNQLVSLDIEIATNQQKIESSNILNASEKSAITNLQNEHLSIDNRLYSIDSEKQQYTAKLKLLADEELQLQDGVVKIKAMLAEKTTAKDALADTINNNRYRYGTLSSNINAVSGTIEEKTNSILQLENNIHANEIRFEQYKTAYETFSESLNHTDEDTIDPKQLEDVRKEIEEFSETKSKLGVELKINNDSLAQLTSELESIRLAINSEENTLNNIDKDLEDMQTRVLEAYGYTYSAAMEFKDKEFDDDVARQEIPVLKESLQRLGGVNMNAIEELEAIRARHEDVSTQMEDIHKADNDLHKVLSDLTKEIQSRFEVGMDQINKNFNEVFNQLFRGGRAKLIYDVAEGKNALDYGIEIEAEPAGKRLQNISLLSGGERTLTAAAILFAILKLNPMPFCVLDEIEAALDDSNAQRIAQYLKTFSKDTQFVVITHKKPTMSNSDALFGVTMEEKGVSRIVSVKLSEAVMHSL